MYMEARQLKGIEIAKTRNITQTPKGFIVQSQNGNGSYLVYKENLKTTRCTCPDHEKRNCKCKHQWAVEYFVGLHKDEFGNITETRHIRVTYPQNWRAYNKAQTSEVKLFDELLKDLVQSIPEQKQTMGRPKLSEKEQFFCAIQKVYSQLSSRRARSLYGNAEERGQIEKAPNFNAINKFLNREDISEILHRLLTLSALPLATVEKKFAPDSSGFATSRFGQYMVEKYGLMKKHKWVKAHILTGTKTNVIVSARITDEYGADCPEFEPLVTDAYENGFNIESITADMGYLSRENYNLANSIGATAFIPFKINSNGKAKGSLIWKKMFHYFQMNREEFLMEYHARSNVEVTFMMVKTKFGEKLKSKKFLAQQNELLCKLIAHNIVVLIHEMYELGIEPLFCSQSPQSAPKVGLVSD